MKDFSWAVNKIKLQQSVEALNKRKLSDSRIEINEKTIKEEYIARGGLLIKDKPRFVNGKNLPPLPEEEQTKPVKYSDMSVKELDAVAEKHNLDTDECENKAELVALLEKEVPQNA